MRRLQLDESAGWRILLDITKIDRIDPWRVNLLRLLEDLEEDLKAMRVSLSHAGIAIYSASLIHRLRSERLLAADKPPEPRERPDLQVPPPIDIPIKPSVVATTLMDVVEALRSVLMSLRESKREDMFEQINTDIKIDDYLLKIEEQVEEFISFLESLLAGKGIVSFRELITDVDRLEAARRFILILFAAARGKVELVQDEGELDILIKPVGSYA